MVLEEASKTSTFGQIFRRSSMSYKKDPILQKQKMCRLALYQTVIYYFNYNENANAHIKKFLDFKLFLNDL